MTVVVRPGGVNVRALPAKDSAKIGSMRVGTQRPALGLVFGDDFTWLSIPWQREDGGNAAWIAAEFTDFSRSAAYSQVAEAWYGSEAVLGFRRSLVRDLLRVRAARPDELTRVLELRGEELFKLEDQHTRQTMLPPYVEFWQMQPHLGLPAPFEYLPVHTSPAGGIAQEQFNGFGPNSFAFRNWELYYNATRGMHGGVDYVVPEGSPLIAVADGVLVDFRFLENPAERSLALRPYLPEQYRTPEGLRVLSNVIVAYGHLTGDPMGQIVRTGDEVRAGQIIGSSGWPVYTRDDGSTGIQHNNAHLHLEVHLVTDGTSRFGSRHPFNPLLFWTPRLIAWQARLASDDALPPYPTDGQPYGRLGFFSVGTFAYDPPRPNVWQFTPTREMPWPPGVYSLSAMVRWLQTFAPYPVDRPE